MHPSGRNQSFVKVVTLNAPVFGDIRICMSAEQRQRPSQQREYMPNELDAAETLLGLHNSDLRERAAGKSSTSQPAQGR